MASESRDDHAVSVSLPMELTDWLSEKAAELGVPEEELVVQVLASYKTAEELDGDPEALLDEDQIEAAVREVVAERIPDIAGAVEENLGPDESIEAIQDQVERELDRLESEISSVESRFQGKLDDVRGRVVQVKKETDAKAPADHSHAELEAVGTLEERLAKLESAVEDIDGVVEDQGETLEELSTETDEVAEIESRLDDVEEKLNTVAWIVSDLREAHEARRGEDRAIQQLKRRAAEEDVDRAICDNCDNAVDIALLTEPTCPHCKSTVNDVRLPGGFFGKPHLEVARQLEAGDDVRDENSNVPDAARR